MVGSFEMLPPLPYHVGGHELRKYDGVVISD